MSDEPCAKEVMMREISCGKAVEEPVRLLGSYDPWRRGILVIQWLLIKTESAIGGQVGGMLDIKEREIMI